MFCANAGGVASSIPPPHSFAPNPYFASGMNARKRRAASPPLIPDPPFTSTSPWDQPTPIASKRRRPNLANGFSGLSLAPKDNGPSSLPSYSESQELEEQRKRIDDDDIFDTTGVPYDRNDVSVEEVLPRRPLAGQRSNSSSTSGYSSDATIPPLRQTLHNPEVELPPEGYIDDGVNVEEVVSRKRRSTSAEGGPSKRPREMDVDMGDIEEIPRRKRSEWYEPEKDRIIYTALSESSRSPSPDRELLSQPGDNGFTISPSMLTRLLATRDSLPLPFPQQKEMGLVLYRPLGIQPGVNMSQTDVENIVREWQDRVATDSGRFESVDEDEDLTLAEADDPAGEGMDIDM